MHALKRELSEGLCPLHETFVALIRLFGSKGLATRGLEILAAMEKLNYNIRQAWLVLTGTHFFYDQLKNKHYIRYKCNYIPMILFLSYL